MAFCMIKKFPGILHDVRRSRWVTCSGLSSRNKRRPARKSTRRLPNRVGRIKEGEPNSYKDGRLNLYRIDVYTGRRLNGLKGIKGLAKYSFLILEAAYWEHKVDGICQVTKPTFPLQNCRQRCGFRHSLRRLSLRVQETNLFRNIRRHLVSGTTVSESATLTPAL